MLRTRLRMRRRGTLRRRLLQLVPGSALPGWGREGPDPLPYRLILALTRQCARLTGAVWLFCCPPHAPPHMHPHTPKIDNGGKSIQVRCVNTTMPLGAVRGQVMLRTRLRMRCPGKPRRRLLRLVPSSASPGWGRGVRTPRPPGSASR